MILKGKVWKFGDNIDTDVIIPARYLNTTSHNELGSHCMEDIVPGFTEKIDKGDVIVGGKNFGCGSSREHAPIAIKAAGISCVIACSFSRIFYRNSINIGLPIIEAPEFAKAIKDQNTVTISLDDGLITDLSTGKEYKGKSFPAFIQEIIQIGGLSNYFRRAKKYE